jgi:hypothetical protein
LVIKGIHKKDYILQQNQNQNQIKKQNQFSLNNENYPYKEPGTESLNIPNIHPGYNGFIINDNRNIYPELEN